MYRSPSPTFLRPDVPSLRRMKPLPKRRRTLSGPPCEDAGETMLPPGLPRDVTSSTMDSSSGSLSVQQALQSYYMPVLGGMRELFDIDCEERTPLSLDFGLMRNEVEEDEDAGDVDYEDRAQQPGNTKKRKVPANLGPGGPGSEEEEGDDGEEEEQGDRAILTGRPDQEYDYGVEQGCSPAIVVNHRRFRIPKATLAGLSHKEMLKSRKRQLATVIGALTYGDTLALDQALSANYPFASSGIAADLQSRDLIRVRLSRRPVSRLARALKAFHSSLPQDSPRYLVPETDFVFKVPSTTSDRLVATREEVSALHARFESELSRQAARAAELAKQTNAVMNGDGPVAKRSAKQSRSASGHSVAEPKPVVVDPSPAGAAATPSKGGKKKKRSALANASNPHHLRNYVPSRLPYSGQINAAQALQNIQNLISPLPVRFLSADVPLHPKKKSSALPAPALSNPAEEWICPRCEYDLFYGDFSAYQRVIKNRKKILRRRRRARERAAAAASGTGPAAAKTSPAYSPSTAVPTTSHDDDAPLEGAQEYSSEPSPATPKYARPKNEQADIRDGEGVK